MKHDAYYMNTAALAYMGDAVYEVRIREHLLKTGMADVSALHRETVSFVRAEAQAAAIRNMLPSLLATEVQLVKRARNKRTDGRPRNVDAKTYKWATGFEALVGYLYLSQQRERMDEIINGAIQIIGESNG